MESIVWNCTDDLSHFFISTGRPMARAFFLMQKIVSAVLDFDPRYVLGDHYIRSL